jgi:hypothetical protein
VWAPVDGCPQCAPDVAPGDRGICRAAAQRHGRRASGPVGRVLCWHVPDQSKHTNSRSDLVAEISAVLSGSEHISRRCAPDVPPAI